jgi:hypothetical protein
LNPIFSFGIDCISISKITPRVPKKKWFYNSIEQPWKSLHVENTYNATKSQFKKREDQNYSTFTVEISNTLYL